MLRTTVILTRLFLGVLFFTAGVGKLLRGFPGLMGPPWLEDVLAKYDLALFAQFVAYSQVLVGLLLLTRFATLGAVMLLPMLLNILVVTISQNWRGTPYVVSVFLLMNIFLLVWDYHKLKFLVSEEVAPLRPLPLVRHHWRLDAAVALTAVVLFTGLALAKTHTTLAWSLTFTSLALLAATWVWQWRIQYKARQQPAQPH